MDSIYQIVRRQFFRLLPFQILLIVVSSVNGIIDSIAASNLIGQDAMTAIGMFGPVNHLLYAVSIMMVSGSQILCGRYMGKNQDRELNNVFSVDLICAFIISVILALAMGIGSRFDIAGAMVSAAGERAALNDYFIGQAIGIPGLLLGQQLFAFLSMENKTRRTMAASIVCALANAGLDYLFVAVFRMGSFGLALASSIASWLFFAVMAVYYLSGKTIMHFSFRGLCLNEFKNIASLGFSGSISRFLEMFRCLIVNALILQYIGSVGLSSFAASNSVMAVFWSLPFGMMAATRMLLSISIGTEDRESTQVNMRIAIQWGMIITGAVAVLIILMAQPLTHLFFQDPEAEVFKMTVMGLRLLPICMPLAIVSLLFCSYYQTMKMKLFSILLPVMDGAGFVVMFSLLLMPSLKMNGLYFANILNGLCCILMVICISIAKKKHFPKMFNDVLIIPEEFGTAEGEHLEFSIRDRKDVVNVSQKVEAFCLESGVDHRRSMLSGLFLEEMAGNVVEHGFHKDKRHKHVVDIRVTCKDADVILRIRDDCIPFDPSERKELIAQEFRDQAKEIRYYMGIPLVYHLSREVIYNNVLGLNVLVIRI